MKKLLLLMTVLFIVSCAPKTEPHTPLYQPGDYVTMKLHDQKAMVVYARCYAAKKPRQCYYGVRTYTTYFTSVQEFELKAYAE